MPIQDETEITMGLGTLELGEYDTNGTFLGYGDVGAIKTELNIAHTREILPFETGRPLITILQGVVRESVQITATLAEINMATIKMALGQGVVTTSVSMTFLDGTNIAPEGTLSSSVFAVTNATLLQFGGSPVHNFVALRFTHQKADLKRIIFEGYKASPLGDLALPFKETDWALYEVKFRLLALTSKPSGQQYYQLGEER